jgi:hypothetical protein
MKKTASTLQIKSYALERTRGNLKRLEWFGAKYHSQSDEDGILHELFERVGTTNKTFVEFGAEIGTENNTRNLLENGWNGLWIEGIPEYIPALKSVGEPFMKAGDLTIIEAYVNPDNINQLIASSKISGEIDLLSIDIDSIDYWVFDAIEVINPRVVVLEHNYAYGPHEKFIMPLDLDYRWDYKNPNDYHHGASISSMVELATKKIIN